MTSSKVPQRKYDVFLSFRGKDTRRGIVSHLLNALKEKKIEVFSDYKLEEGNEISPTLLRAIENSYISLVIFSKGYVDSKWCLEELEKIIDCMKNYKQIVIPIFYDIDPSTVRHQKGCYGDAFRRQEEKFKHDSFKIQSWKTSLKKAADLSGFDSSNFENDAELVKQIVNRAWEILKNIMPPNDSIELIGIHEQITELELLLCQRLQDVHIIGIWGMGGIGKTTIASLLFEKLSYEYEGCYFLENVRKELGKYGITLMKNKLISKLLGGEDLDFTLPVGLPFNIKGRLRHKKVLVVLDDVDDSEQVKDLTGAYDWFGPSSTIITSSRDKSVLIKYCSKIYEVKALSPEPSLQLFSLHAFRDGCHKLEGSHKLSLRVIDYAKGNPLALKVLGSFLNGKSKAEWRSELRKLEKMPFPKIQSVLKLSYDTLDQSDKDIFLYIACFFKGFFKQQIISLLDSSLHPTIGLRTLEDKALVTTSYGEVTMHDLIQEMGQQIVREKSLEDSSKCHHLWDHNDIYKVLKNNSGTEHIESISLQCQRIKDIHLSSKVFKGMINLKYLNFQCESGLHISDKSFDSLPKNLKCFYWERYSLKSLPSKLCLKNLIQLHLCNSKVKRLWNGTQNLGNLKEINLSGCELLEDLPNMSKASKLEIVDLSGCIRLRHVHPSFLSNHNLVELYLTSCKRLQSLKSHVHLRSLKHLSAFNCPNLKEFSMSSKQLKTLSLAWTCIENVYSPNTLCLINSLTILNLNGSKLVTLPESIKHLSNLEQLHLCGCSMLQSIPELPPSIKVLDANSCRSLEAIFTSNSARPGSKINTRDPFLVYLTNCWKLGEDTVNAVAMDFVLVTMGVVYQQPTPSKHLSYCNHSEVCLPGSKVGNVLNFQTSEGCKSEISIQVPLNSDLMAFIFCFAIGKETGYQLRCCCFVHLSNGESIEYNKIVLMPCVFGDHVMLWYYGDFNHNIMNGIKESRASSSPTDEYTKVSFKIYDYHKFGIKGIGVYPIYASELHSLSSTNTERSEDNAHPQLMMKKKKRKLALQKSVNSLRLSKQRLPHSQEEKKKSKKLKAIHLPTAT